MFKALENDRLFFKAQKIAAQHQPEMALSIFDRIISQDRSNSGIHLHKALVLAELGHYQEAILALESAIRRKPQSAVYQTFLGIVHYDYHQFDMASRAFLKALEIEPNYLLPLFFNDLADCGRGDLQALSRILKRGIPNTNMDFQSRLLVFCESYLSQNQISGPILADLLDFHPGQSRFKNKWLIEIKWFMIRLCGYVAFWRDSAAKTARTCFGEGAKQFQYGNFEAAQKEFWKALDAWPNYDRAKQQLLELSLAISDYRSAIGFIEQIVEFQSVLQLNVKLAKVGPETAAYSLPSPVVVLVLGVVYYHLGQFELAQNYLHLARSLDKKNYWIYYYLGLCQIGQGEPGQARLWFKQALTEVNFGIVGKRLRQTIQAVASGCPYHIG
jgi:tetratricopeptide (TPR) repeat protein